MAGQGEELDGSTVKRLNVLEMMKEFRSNMDASDNDDVSVNADADEDVGNDSTQQNVSDRKSASSDKKSPPDSSSVRVCRLMSYCKSERVLLTHAL